MNPLNPSIFNRYIVAALSVFFILPVPSFAKVLITEVEYNSSFDENEGEWFELYNTENIDIDISGWEIHEDDSGRYFEFPTGTIISGHSHFIATNHIPTFQLEHPTITPDIEMAGGIGCGSGNECIRLNNSVGTDGVMDNLTLFNTLNEQQDFVEWPTDATAGNGKSICRVFTTDSFTDTDLPSDWESDCTPSPGIIPFTPPTPIPTPVSKPVQTPIVTQAPVVIISNSTENSSSQGSGGSNPVILEQLKKSGTAYKNANPTTETPTITPIPSQVPSITQTVSSAECARIQLDRSPEKRGSGEFDNTFIDVNITDKGYEALIDLAEQYIISGDNISGNDITKNTMQTTARLQSPLSRAEFVKIMSIAREDELACITGNSFPDVQKSEWYFDFVWNMQFHDIVHGYSDGYYAPERNISLAESYKIFAIGFGFITKDEASRISQKEDTQWFVPYKNVLSKNNVIPADLLNVSDEKAIQRWQAFIILSNILKDKDSL